MKTKKTMLTYRTLDRFEEEYTVDQYTEAEIERIEHDAYVANMNVCAHPEWTEDDIFAWFLHCVKDIDGIELKKEEEKNVEKMVEEITAQVENSKAKSAWERGVKEYALEMLEEMAFNAKHGYIDADVFSNGKMLKDALLNGASDWKQYSWGGCSLIYDGDIAERLCAPWELKKTRNGERRPNSREEWLDTQARALNQAGRLIVRSFEKIQKSA